MIAWCHIGSCPCVFVCFCFQAEDGIRDLVRSRGLGDVYKRQVWEWVADWYGESYYAVSPRENPTGPAEGERRVLRGGAYNSILYNVGACFREGAVITDRGDTSGFRVVRDAAPD